MQGGRSRVNIKGVADPLQPEWGTANWGTHSPRPLPADDGLSSQTRLVRGVLRLQSPSECTEETEGGRSPEDRPGAGDLALRLLGLAAIFGFPPPPAKRDASSVTQLDARGLRQGCRYPALLLEGLAKIAHDRSKAHPKAGGTMGGKGEEVSSAVGWEGSHGGSKRVFVPSCLLSVLWADAINCLMAWIWGRSC